MLYRFLKPKPKSQVFLQTNFPALANTDAAESSTKAQHLPSSDGLIFPMRIKFQIYVSNLTRFLYIIYMV